MATPAYLGLDIGGTGAKAGVFDARGRALGHAQRGYTPHATESGGAEIPIEIIEQAARDAAREATALSGAEIRALSVVSQGQTFVSLDTHGSPLHPVILWYDSRGALEAEAIRLAIEAGEPEGARPVVQAISSASKILWLKTHHPAQMERAARHLLLPDLFTYRLTGIPVTDPCTASSSGLYAAGQPSYSAAALRAARIDPGTLAAVQPSGSPVGRITAEAAREWGLPTGALVVTGTNDQYAGALGAGVHRPGIVSSATGTCLSLVTLTRELPARLPPGLFGGVFPIPGYRFVLAYAKTAGVVLDWFRRTLAPTLSLAELDGMAAASPPGSRGLTVCPHFDGMVSPTPTPAMRGFFANLGLNHSLGDMYRALLESLACALRENLDLIAAQGLAIDTVRSIGGGARSDVWLQMEADFSGLPVERPRTTESATLGAAMLAALGAGAFHSLEESCRTLYATGQVFTPRPAVRDACEAAFVRYRTWCARAGGDAR